ncbi:MAG: hypothetical protein AAB316_24475, partial [Bacteroidota bacterium]
HPKEAKLQLAQNIVEQFCGPTKAKAARDYFEKAFSQRAAPDIELEFQLNFQFPYFFNFTLRQLPVRR